MIDNYIIEKWVATNKDDLEPIYLSIEDLDNIISRFAGSILGFSSKYFYMIQDEKYKSLFKAYIKIPIENDLIRYPEFDNVDDKYDLLLKDHEGFNKLVKDYNELIAEIRIKFSEIKSWYRGLENLYIILILYKRKYNQIWQMVI